MASGVVFGSPPSLLLQPGAYTKVDPSALNLPQPFAYNVPCIIGAALAGTPMRVYALSDPAQADETFGPGSPLADAVKFAFKGGVKGGAPLVLAVRIDPSGQASAVVNAANGTSLAATFLDYGGYGNTFSLQFMPGSLQGTMAVLRGTTVSNRPFYKKIDNQPSFGTLIEQINALGLVDVNVTAGGTRASQTITIATSQQSGLAQLADARGTVRTTDAYLYQYPQSFLDNAVDSLTASFNATIAWDIASVDAATDTFTATGHTLVNGNTVRFTGTAIAGLTAGTTYFVVNAAVNTFKVALTEGGTAIDLAGAVTSARVILQFGATTITSSIPAALEGTYTPAAVNDAYTQNIAGGLTNTAYGSNIFRITLSSGNWAHANGRGVIGSIFTVASGPYAGTYQILHHEWDGLSGDRTRTVQRLTAGAIGEGAISLSLSFWPTIRFPRLQPPTEALESVLPLNGQLPRGGFYFTVRINDKTVNYTADIGDSIQNVGQQIANRINASADFQGVAIAAAAYNGGTFTSTITVQAVDPGIVPNAWPVQVIVNVQEAVLAASGGATLSGGVDPQPPRNAQGQISGLLDFSGGFDSTPTYQRWLDGLNLVRYQPLRSLIPAGTDNLGVQLAFVDHCEEMSTTPRRRERIAILGHGLGWSHQQILARIRLFDSPRTAFCVGGHETADSLTGLPRFYSAHQITAPRVAGMLAAEGNAINDPITHTYLDGITRLELIYNEGSLELDELIEAGGLVITPDPTLVRRSRGFRVCRAITTQRSSTAFQNITTVNQSDYVAQSVRDRQETLFVGSAIEPDVLAAMREDLNRQLQGFKDARIIYGYDERFTTVSINPTLQSAVDAKYKIYPSPDLEFVLNTQLLFPIPQAERTAIAV